MNVYPISLPVAFKVLLQKADLSFPMFLGARADGVYGQGALETQIWSQ